MDPVRNNGFFSRRKVLLLGTGTLVGGGLVAACGGDDRGARRQSTEATSAGAPAGGAEPLVATSQVPVGGAVPAEASDGAPVLVSQPTAGEFVAFSAVCTHQGCTVAPADGLIRCPCHGSTFDLSTGENTGGPAPEPLPELSVEVRDGSVFEA